MKKSILAALLCLAAVGVKAQGIRGVSAAFQTESIAIPFSRVAPIHPGAELGLALAQKSKPQSLRRWSVYAGWFYHKDLDHGLYVRGEYAFVYRLKSTFELQVPVGLGYMHSFHPKPMYTQNADGSFSQKQQGGRPHALLTVGLGLSYLKLGQVQPFVKYEVFAQSPFVTTVPVVVRNFLKIGTTFQLQP